MDSKELLAEMAMGYDVLVTYLLKKYGKAKSDYFTNTTCKTKSKKISRTNEGLFCHHIDEDKGGKLSDSQFAIQQSFEYQKAERLVYCNYIEHLLLHIQIGKDMYWKKYTKLDAPKNFSFFVVPGITYICADINSLFSDNGSTVPWKNRCYLEIKNNFDDYIFILQSFIKYLLENYSGNINQKSISVGQHVHHKLLGDGVITNISGDELWGLVTVKFSSGEKIVSRNVIDKGNYKDSIIKIKKNLSSDYKGNVISLIYDRL